jgi:hypothetical protein
VQHPSCPLATAQFSTIKSPGLNDPKRPEKYNKNEEKNGSTFYGCHIALDT